MSFLCLYCLLWIYFTHWFSCIIYIDTDFTNSCFHCFEQLNTIWEGFKNQNKYTLLKLLSRKSFYVKKSFANNINDSRINEMLCSVKLEVEDLLMVNKLGFRFWIFYCLKIWQNFEMEVCLLRGRTGEY